MGYFASGSPKSYELPQGLHASTTTAAFETDPRYTETVALEKDPAGLHLLSVTRTSIHIWSARQHRALVARFVLGPTALKEEGPFVSATWSPDGKSLVAGLSAGLVLIFDVIPVPLEDGRKGILNFQSPDLADEALIESEPILPVLLKRVAEARVARSGTLTAMCSALAGALLGTSEGGLTCVSWDGDVLWRVHVPELLRKNCALSKMGIINGNENDRGMALSSEPAIAAIQTESDDDSAKGVVAIAYNAILSFIGIVLGSGPALLLSSVDGCVSQPNAIDGRWLRSTKAVSIALEPKRMLATVGLSDGDVEQYYVGVPPGDKCPVMRKLSLSGWYFEPTDIGSASVLQWTEDGSALVVGWEKRGLAVWSVSGCRLMWTLPQVGGTLPTTPGLRGKDSSATIKTFVHPMEQGVSALAWGPNGLYLWAAPRKCQGSSRVTQDSHFMEFTFYKSTVCGVSAQREASRLALLGTDRVLLLAHADGKGLSASRGAPSNDLFSWQHLIIPHDYLWENWPPSHMAVSDDSSLVAVAGEHGVALCQTRSQRWKVFGDLRHDRRIKCCALAWIGKTIVVGNKIDTGASGGYGKGGYELLLYHRDQQDSTKLQAQCRLKTRPLLMDVRVDGYLLVLCEDSLVYLFKITERRESAAELKLVYEVFLPTREKRPESAHTAQCKNDYRATNPRVDPTAYLRSLPAPGGGISSVRIFPPLDQATEGLPPEAEIPVPRQLMLLRSTGSLILLNTENMVSTPLLRYVERFWYTPPDCKPFEDAAHRPVWWAYGDDGLHVCFPDGMGRYLEKPSNRNANGIFVPSDDEDVNAQSSGVPHSSSRRSGVCVEQWFELDPEVYPLNIMPVSGMVLGATQGLISHSTGAEGGDIPCQVIQVKRQPILHTLLRHLLLKPTSDDRIALQVALKCVSQPQFADSLEWLLYEAVLEHDDDNGAVNMPMFHGNLETRNDYSSFRSVLDERGGMSLPFSESSRWRSSGSVLFPRVIRLLRYFGEYEDIVVRCARKLDSKRWPLLFSLAGEPAALMEQCFMSGRLRTAACLLVILQEMWGFISSTPHSLRLVEAALERGELSLAADLANFLAKADRAGMLNSSQLRTIEDVSWIAEATLVPQGAALSAYASGRRDTDSRPTRLPAVDLAVLKHAHVLLSRMDFRNLAALAVRMDFPLTAWLRRELVGKNSSQPFVRDFGSTILSLHRQFQYSEPSVEAVTEALAQCENLQKEDSSVNGIESTSREEQDVSEADVKNKCTSLTPRTFATNANTELTGLASDTVFGSQLPPPPSVYDSEELHSIRAKARRLCRQELQYLLTVARTAETPDLMLCFATLLIDISEIRAVFKRYPELRAPYIAALADFDVPGYSAFVDILSDELLHRPLPTQEV